MQKKIKKPELLAPAGNLEKLKIAVRYGADAVYIGGRAYGLRSRAGNFSLDEMKEGAAFAHEHGAKLYVAANMVVHEGDAEGADDFFRALQAISVDAVIISDPALLAICFRAASGLPVHLSTQASTTNYKALEFWKEIGVRRVVLAREVGLEEIRAMRRHCDIELEAFVHGAMCIAYSGRCTLSNHMVCRDANRGGCAQSCRWKYNLLAIDGQKEKSLLPTGAEPFSMSAVDLSMLRHLPDMIDAGIDSLKIEGRMKSIHYVSTVCNAYRQAIDRYCADPGRFNFDPIWEEEIRKTAQRDLSTGFYYGVPTEKEQLFGQPRQLPKYTFAAQVVGYDPATKRATLEQRNNFGVGEEVEFYGPDFVHFRQKVCDMRDEDGTAIDRAPNPLMTVTIPVDRPVKPFYLMRKK
ncbi:MAG: U32 family peptidase [Sporolactobacillus sp.]|jgi:putative protease|nr:U32 family peptidase [Sporolactobacillus sp.]